MPNVLTLPASGIIQFNRQSFPSFTQQPLSASVQLEGDTEGGLRVYSTATAASAVDRFFVDGKEGRLFTVSDVLTGTLFSANDVSGLPILEVKDTDTVVMGEFNTNTLVVSGRRVGIGNNPFTSSVLSVSGNVNVAGNLTSRVPLISTGSTTYTLALSDDSTLITINTSASSVVIVPNDSVVNFSRGSVVGVTRYGTGAVTISSASSVILRSADSMLRLRERYSTGTLVKLANNDWLLFGDLAL